MDKNNQKFDYWRCSDYADHSCDSEYLFNACNGCYKKKKKLCSHCTGDSDCDRCYVGDREENK